MDNSLKQRKKRLIFRCNHMGTAENDHLFGLFARDCVEALDMAGVEQLERLLEENDVDLFKWITGKAAVPEHLQTPVMAQLQIFGRAND